MTQITIEVTEEEYLNSKSGSRMCSPILDRVESAYEKEKNKIQSGDWILNTDTDYVFKANDRTDYNEEIYDNMRKLSPALQELLSKEIN